MHEQVLSLGAYELRLPDLWGDTEVLGQPPIRRVIFGQSGVSGNILVGEELGSAENVDLYLGEQVERFPGTVSRDTLDVLGCSFERRIVDSAAIDDEVTGSVRVHATIAYGDLIGFRMMAADPVDPTFDKLCFSVALSVVTMLRQRGKMSAVAE